MSFVFIVVVVNVLVYIMQPRMIFYPSSSLVSSPSDWGLPYENVALTTADERQLHGWFIPAPGAQKTVLFCLGNAGNISHRGASVNLFHQQGWNVFIFDYRGYGQSTGSPHEQGLYRDARAAWAYLTGEKNIAPSDIIVFGRSLGGAVAVELVTHVQPAALIVESSFSSVRDMASRVFPVVHYLLISRYRFAAKKALPEIHTPVLIVHSRDDEIIPYANGERLYNAANEPKRMLTINGDHNGGFLLSGDTYREGLRQFIRDFTD